MPSKSLLFTARDQKRLRQFISEQTARLAGEAKALALLNGTVESGQIVDAQEVPPDLVTMYSQVRLQDIDSGHFYVATVALPPEGEHTGGESLSRAYPAAALLGERVGAEIAWRSARRHHRARIAELLFQPNLSARRPQRQAQPESGTPTQMNVRTPETQPAYRRRGSLKSQEIRT